jgi:hypothetical protein
MLSSCKYYFSGVVPVISDLMFSNWVSFLDYPKLFGFKGFVVVVVVVVVSILA